MLSISYFYTFCFSFLLCAFMVPPVSRLAAKLGCLDHPDHRKVHTSPTPRLGGFAIFSALVLTMLLFTPITQQIRGFLVGGIIIFIIGFIDDIYQINPIQKFTGEFLAVSLFIAISQLSFQNLGNPVGIGPLNLGYASIPFTIFALVGIINALNLMDGLDGLATGIAIIATISFSILAYISGNIELLSITIPLLGTLLAFFWYNNNPATIFLGDCGSLLIGYTLGASALLLSSGGKTHLSPWLSFMILSLPIIDTVVVMIQRKQRGVKLFSPDKTHIHHKLLELNFDKRIVVIIIYSMAYFINAAALIMRNQNDTIIMTSTITFSIVLYNIINHLNNIGITRFASIIKTAETIKRYCSRYLQTAIKYILIIILLLPSFIKYEEIPLVAIIPLILFMTETLCYTITNKWSQTVLNIVLYISGFWLVLVLERFGRYNFAGNLSLNLISHGLYTLLFILSGLKLYLRSKVPIFMSSPFAYLILMIIISSFLIPSEFIAPYHLLTVGAKSIILFTSFKLVLMNEIKRNKKILFATAISLILITLKHWL